MQPMEPGPGHHVFQRDDAWDLAVVCWGSAAVLSLA